MTWLGPVKAAFFLENSSQDLVRHRRLLWMLRHFEEMHGTVISLGDDGNLIDGHHRCTIVALTGKPLLVDFQIQPYRLERD